VIGEYAGQVVRVVCVLMAPLIMLFGLYVVAHGHYGPGGGFAGGIVIGVGVILLRITVATEISHRAFPPTAARIAGGLGVLGFVLTGLVPLLAGGPFLDYAAVDLPGMDDPDARYLGILVVEVFVGLAVTSVMVTLFDTLVRDEADA
jgi:multicomponent Na+:H+ antiporter subunit B